MERIEKLLEFLNENPKDNFVRHALAMEYLKLERTDEARHLLERLLNDSPEYIGSYYQLGKIFEKTGDETSAIKWYEQGIKYAKQAGNRHTLNELQSALDGLTY